MRTFASTVSTAKRNTFVQYYGSSELDAALLRLPLVGFLPANDSRIVGTVDAIQQELVEGGLVQRAPWTHRESLQRARFYHAASGWSTVWSRWAVTKKREQFMSGCSACAMMSVCFRRNMILEKAACWGIFLKRSLTSH